MTGASNYRLIRYHCATLGSYPMTCWFFVGFLLDRSYLNNIRDAGLDKYDKLDKSITEIEQELN